MQATGEKGDLYFRYQATVGMTKHMGGDTVTDELIDLCHIQPGGHVLDVGCGVGFSSCYIAEQTQARLVGVDLRPDMVARAKEYAADTGLTDCVTFRVADAQALPFGADMFDAVICESVLAFVPDRAQALREFLRVTKPGGYIGFTEAIWHDEPSPEMMAFLADYTGPEANLMTSDGWEALLDESGLTDTVVHTYEVSPLSDAKSQIKRVGFGRLMRIWGRSLQLVARDKAYREFMGDAVKLPKSLIGNMGYGVYVGRKSRE